MCGVYYQKTHGHFSDEAKVTGLLPLVKRIDHEKRVILARVCSLIYSCGIHRESVDDMVDAWGPIMLSLSTKNAKLATACVMLRRCDCASRAQATAPPSLSFYSTLPSMTHALPLAASMTRLQRTIERLLLLLLLLLRRTRARTSTAGAASSFSW